MSKDLIHIEPTNKTPEVFLNPKGSLKITGRAIDESRTKFSEQIIEWIDTYLASPANLTEVTIALEYLNSYNSIILASIIRQIYQVTQQSKKIVIKWIRMMMIFLNGEDISHQLLVFPLNLS